MMATTSGCCCCCCSTGAGAVVIGSGELTRTRRVEGSGGMLGGRTRRGSLEKEELEVDDDRFAMIGFLSLEWNRTWIP